MENMPENSVPEGGTSAGKVQKHPRIGFYLLCLVLACLIPGVIGAVALIAHQERSNREALENASIQTARALVQVVDGEVLKRIAILESLATSQAARERDFNGIYRLMERINSRPSLASMFSLTDKDGQLIANTTLPFGSPLPKHGNPLHIEEVIKSRQPVVSDLFTGSIYNDQVVTASVPMVVDGEVDYIMSATLRGDLFAAILKNEGISPDWRSAILDREGRFIARVISGDDAPLVTRNELLRGELKGAAEGAFETESFNGTPLLTVYSRSKFTGWTVVLGMPLEPLEREYQSTLYMLLSGITLLFSFVLVLAWWMSDRISHSVRALIPPAQQLGEGRPVELDTIQLEVEETDEVAHALVDASKLLRQRTEALTAERDSRQQQIDQMVIERTRALEAAKQASEALARRDVLTGLMNRLAANERLLEEFLRMKRIGSSYAVLLIDIDHFKQVNDTYGHDTGDQVLKTVADLLEANLRATDFVFRYGGEEFLVLLPATGLEGAQVFGEKLRAALEAHHFGSGMKITISIGISIAETTDNDDHATVNRADTALYRAKNGGRNQLQWC